MEIDVNQRKIAIGYKYDIYCQGKQIRYAHSKLLQFLTHIELSDSEAGKCLLTLVKRLSFLRTNYDIQFPGEYVVEFRTVSVWKAHYRCIYGKDTFDIYSHKGRKHSVYKNGCQVAWWDQEAVTWFEGDNYKIIADDDCDADLIIAFCLILDDSKNNNTDRSMFKFNMGHIGPQAKEFDMRWHPNAGKKVNAEADVIPA